MNESEINTRDADVFSTYMKKCKREIDSFMFGPGGRKDFEHLRRVLNDHRIGYFASYADTKSKDIGDKIYINVLHHQAGKLSQVLIKMNIKEEKDFLKSIEDQITPETEPLIVKQESLEKVADSAKVLSGWNKLMKKPE